MSKDNASMEIKKTRYNVLGPKMVEVMNKKDYEAYYCSTCEEALEKALELIPSDAVTGYGGCLSMNAIGLKEAIRTHCKKVLDRDLAPNMDVKREIERETFKADWFITGCNAISEDGQMVNIDGYGNRVAALAFGPKNVLVICGLNKVCKTLEDAVHRAKNIAAPANAARFPQYDLPCTKTGMCANCNSHDCICSTVTITRRCWPANRIKVIFIGEDLGL